jgi:hypothetical protein
MQHIIISQAYKSLEFIPRNSKSFKSVDVLKTLYSSIVRSIHPWSGDHSTCMRRKGLERVQRRFLSIFSLRLRDIFHPGVRIRQGCIGNSAWSPCNAGEILPTRNFSVN